MPGPAARSVVAYNLGRLALFVVCLVLGFLAGLRSVTLLVVALVVSGVLSYFLLARQRIAMATAVTDAVSRGRDKVARRTAEEDAYVEQMLAEQVTQPAPERARPHDVTRTDR